MFFSYYNAPQLQLDISALKEISDKYQNVVIVGDLNAQSSNLGCRNTNKNWELLEELLFDSKFLIVNDKTPTYHRMHDNSEEILDWCIISSSMHKNFVSFEVLKDNLVDSDHVPMQIKLSKVKNKQATTIEKELSKRYNLNKADWINFAKDLNDVKPQDKLSIDELNSFIIQEIIKACDKNIPIIKASGSNKTLPQFLLDIITHRKTVKNLIKKNKDTTKIQIMKKEYNLLTEIIRQEVSAIENNRWKKFLNKVGNKHPTSSSQFWKRINFHKPKQTSIKTLIFKNKMYHTDLEKANIFANILATTFSKEKSNDKTFGEAFDKIVEDKYKNINNSDGKQVIRLITKTELEKVIKNTNNKNSSGADKISNAIIKKTSTKFQYNNFITFQ